jgi:D-alanine-D-alanine ligase
MSKNIAVVTGGSAAEVGISLKSAAVVCKHLEGDKYNPYKVILGESEWSVEKNDIKVGIIDKNDFSFTQNGNKVTFDAVFVALHGTPAEDGKLQGYFELLGIPYNCCNVLSAALTFDKLRCKDYLKSFGVATAKAMLFTNSVLTEAQKEEIDTFAFPLFVKPNKNGSSYGAAKVDATDELEAALANGLKYDDEVIVEEFLKGTEVTCGVIVHNGKITALPITEIRSKNAFFDYKAKYEGDSQEITPAEISGELTNAIQATSEAIYVQLGFKGMCRVDYIIRNDIYYMLEVNSVPGLSEESLIPQQARAHGLTLKELFEESIENCLNK